MSKPIPNLRRIVVLLEADTLKDIDEVRFRRRFLSRMETIRSLLRSAIDRELGKKPRKGGVKMRENPPDSVSRTRKLSRD